MKFIVDAQLPRRLGEHSRDDFAFDDLNGPCAEGQQLLVCINAELMVDGAKLLWISLQPAQTLLHQFPRCLPLIKPLQ